MYINEVKRDKETLKKISEFQNSIENLVSPRGVTCAAKYTVTVCAGPALLHLKPD